MPFSLKMLCFQGSFYALQPIKVQQKMSVLENGFKVDIETKVDIDDELQACFKNINPGVDYTFTVTTLLKGKTISMRFVTLKAQIQEAGFSRVPSIRLKSPNSGLESEILKHMDSGDIDTDALAAALMFRSKSVKKNRKRSDIDQQ